MSFLRINTKITDGTCQNLSITNKFTKYLFVGILNTVFGYSLFALLIFINLHYTLASLLATIAGVLFNFKTMALRIF